MFCFESVSKQLKGEIYNCPVFIRVLVPKNTEEQNSNSIMSGADKRVFWR